MELSHLHRNNFRARILERQKMLQKSQVLSRRLYVSCAAVSPFKDSEGGTWPCSYRILKGLTFAGTRQ